MNQHKQILVVYPHPDDEAFGAAGILSMYAQNGAKITYACLTLGEMGRNMGFPPFANRVTLPEIRKKELRASCKAIGIQDLRMLGFHDKMIEFEEEAKLDATIEGLLSELRPSLVVTFYPGYSVHPDHDATGAAVIRVVGKLPKEERPTVYCNAFSKDCELILGEPDLVLDVTPYMEAKSASIMAHRSQFQAAELIGKGQMTEEEIHKRFGTERFWIYHFD